jgi:transglutaminase-like putative cysteine protease
MILQVLHTTAYDYANRVELASHLLHLRPRDLPQQRVLRFDLTAEPAASRTTWGTDHYGNPVIWLSMDTAHHALRLTATSLVEVLPRTTPNPAATPAWEHVASQCRRHAAAADVAEFSFCSPKAPTLAEAGVWAAPSFSPGRPVLAGLLDLMARIGREFRFQAGVTGVGTTVARVLELRAGVCQDFAHLMISGLRSLGLPARYVSGYIRTRPPPGQRRLRGADQSHAWVGCWLGPKWGWIDLDPTNDLIVGDEHVVLGWGRDYLDVSPVLGILLGGGEHTLDVGVDIEPVDEAAQPGGGWSGDHPRFVIAK